MTGPQLSVMATWNGDSLRRRRCQPSMCPPGVRERARQCQHAVTAGEEVGKWVALGQQALFLTLLLKEQPDTKRTKKHRIVTKRIAIFPTHLPVGASIQSWRNQT